MDKLVRKIAALGIPGLVLLYVIGLTGLAGGAAFTASLALLGGPLGMFGGLLVLGLGVLIVNGVSKYGLDILAIEVIKKLKKKHSIEKIRTVINKLPISKEIKRKINEHLPER